MQAYHNKQEVKDKYLERIKQHIDKGTLRQKKVGWDPQKQEGCAVGCTMEEYNHGLYPTQMGIPVELAYTEDALFEGLPLDQARQFVYDFLEAIPVGSNLTRVWFKLVHWILTSFVPWDSWLGAEDERYNERLRGAYHSIREGLYSSGYGYDWWRSGGYLEKRSWLAHSEQAMVVESTGVPEGYYRLLTYAAYSAYGITPGSDSTVAVNHSYLLPVQSNVQGIVFWAARVNTTAPKERLSSDRIYKRYAQMANKLIELLDETA